jgi:hypothetical protein
MKTMPDWLSRAAALPARLHSTRWQSHDQCRGIDDPSGVESPPCSRGMISSRRAVAPQSALLCANAGPQAIDSVTRVSSRVEFIEVEFNGTGVRSPYMKYQGIRIGCCKQIARSLDSTLASRSVITSSRPTRVYNRSIQEKRK